MSSGFAQGLDLWQSPTKALKGGIEHHSENDDCGDEWQRDSGARPDLGKLSAERRDELASVLFAASDYYREFADPNPEASAVAMGHLFLRSGRSLKEFHDVMLLTRQQVRIAQGQQRAGEFIRNKGAYFYTAVRNNLERIHDPSREPHRATQRPKVVGLCPCTKPNPWSALRRETRARHGAMRAEVVRRRSVVHGDKTPCQSSRDSPNTGLYAAAPETVGQAVRLPGGYYQREGSRGWCEYAAFGPDHEPPTGEDAAALALTCTEVHS